MNFIDYVTVDKNNRRKEHVFNDGKEYKQCNKCHNYISLNGFSNNKCRWDHLMSTCKDCLKKYVVNTEKRKQYQKAYYYRRKDKLKIVNFNISDVL